MRSPALTRISEGRRSSRPGDPPDYPVVNPLEIERPHVLDPDPEVVEDPLVRFPLPTTRADVPELMKQQTDQVSFRERPGERQGADRIPIVERVHERPLALDAGVVGAEADDFWAVHPKLRPGERRLRGRDEPLHQAKREREPGRDPVTG
jgi:hypothetical protein